jgi:hypothetical protein
LRRDVVYSATQRTRVSESVRVRDMEV